MNKLIIALCALLIMVVFALLAYLIADRAFVETWDANAIMIGKEKSTTCTTDSDGLVSCDTDYYWIFDNDTVVSECNVGITAYDSGLVGAEYTIIMGEGRLRS